MFEQDITLIRKIEDRSLVEKYIYLWVDFEGWIKYKIDSNSVVKINNI